MGHCIIYMCYNVVIAERSESDVQLYTIWSRNESIPTTTNATLISTLRPTPIPAYQTCSPYESAQLFSHYGTACNNGCGC